MKERVFFKFVTALRFGEALLGLKSTVPAQAYSLDMAAGTGIAGLTMTKTPLSVNKPDMVNIVVINQNFRTT